MPPARLPEHFHWLTVQRKCKSNAEYQACLNILLRCSFSSLKKMQTSAMKACFQIAECCFSSAKIIHFSAVCSFVEWLVKQNRSKKARNSAVSCWLCVEYANFDFLRIISVALHCKLLEIIQMWSKWSWSKWSNSIFESIFLA